MDLDDARIGVIGGAGFIGSHLVEQLTETGAEDILVYDNLTRGTRENLERALKDDRVRLTEGDITHTDVLNDALSDRDAVFHLAALWLMHCHEYQRAALQVNIEGSFNVLEACRDNNVDKLVYSSSASVYGDATNVPMTEDHPFNNRTFYGATKIAGEEMLQAFNERYGLDYAGLRYMNVYGPRQDYKGAYTAVMMKMLDRMDEGKPPIVHGDGSQTFDFVFVEDVARANVAAMQSDVSDEFYNVGRGEATTIKELGQLLIEITNSDLEIQYEEADREFVTHRIGSTKKAKRDLGFDAQENLREGLEELVRWRNQQPDTKEYDV